MLLRREFDYPGINDRGLYYRHPVTQKQQIVSQEWF